MPRKSLKHFLSVFFLLFAVLAITSNARSWDVAVVIGHEIDFFSRNQTLTGQATVAGAVSLRGIAYDDKTRTLYLSDTRNNVSIFSNDLTKKNFTSKPLLKKPNGTHIVAIAFDAASRTLFWSDALKRVIMKMRVPVDGPPEEPILLHKLTQVPRGIALDVCNSHIYWTNSDKYNPSIQRSNLDGSDRTTVIKENLYEPMGLAVDHAEGKLYWSDDEEGIDFKIERSNLDGSEREILLHSRNQQPVYLAVDKSTVYWSDWVHTAVWTMPKNFTTYDAPIKFKSYHQSNRDADPAAIVARDNVGTIDCAVLLNEKQERKKPREKQREKLPSAESYNNLTTSTEEVESVTEKSRLCLNGGTFDNVKGSCRCKAGFKSWYDYKLRWEPKEYGGVHMLHVPSDHIWRPDIVLYNNADGNFEVTLATKATIYHQGLVEWKPPAIYKSSCEIDVEYFPFDEQTCVLKFGSWTYDGFKVDLRHMDEKSGSNVVDVGVDLSEFYMSVEWDILEVPAVRNEKFYTCCDEPYLDITFNITMRRKTLFYTVNIIIPCMGISFLTVLTFYLPSDSGEKVTLSISILISLHVFFLLVVEIIPPTSLVVPLLGKYLIFAMILVSISICVTVVVLNVHFRSPQTHQMAPWVKRVFIHILPRLLVMRRPQYKFETSRYTSGRVLMRTVRGKEKTCYYPYHPSTHEESEEHFTPKRFHSRPSSKEDLSPSSLTDGARFGGSCLIHGPPLPPLPIRGECEDLPGEAGIEEVKSPVLRNPPAFSHSRCPPEIHRSCICVRFIAEHTKMLEDSTKVKEDWKYVAMVLDRLFLWIFTLAVLVGTAGIILQAPTLYDDRVPIDKKFSEFATTTVVKCPPQ